VELIERYYISLELASGGTLSDWIGIPFLNFNMMKETDVIHCVKYVPYPFEYTYESDKSLKVSNISIPRRSFIGISSLIISSLKQTAQDHKL